MPKPGKTPSSSSSSSSSRAPQGGRREALRREQQAKAAAQARTGRLMKAAWATGLGVIAVMVAVIVWTLVRGGSAAPATGALVAPAGATSNGAILFGDSTAKVTVAVYADFMCPYCGQFEQANGDDLNAAVAAGKAKLELHPMSFLDDSSAGSRYSTRSANAFVTLANADPAVALKFHRLLFANQPKEGSSGLSDARLAEIAREAGATEAMTATFASSTYVPWVKQATQQAFDSGITGTPTVKIDGQVFSGDLYTTGPLSAAIDQAANA
jgi:protein-disulfide isomerase